MSMNKVNMSLDEIIKKGRSNQRKDNNNFRRRSRNPNQNQGMLRRRNFGGERRRGSNRMNNRSSFENNPKFFNRQNVRDHKIFKFYSGREDIFLNKRNIPAI